MKNKILLIEDDDSIRTLYQEDLTRSGFEVLACISAEDGLKALEQRVFDIVLLDIMLPGMNGLEALKQVKLDPKTKDLKIVLLTNLGQEAVIKQGFEMGAIGFLIKSAYNPDQIINEVKTFIES